MAISVSLNGETFEQVIYTKEDAFEQLVAKNAETIFGNKAIYINAKRKLRSSLGEMIPDGFLIDLSDSDDPQFYLVEVELQSHGFLDHILKQITKFIASCKDSEHRDKLIETLLSLPVVKEKIENLTGSREIYKFLKDTINNNQEILIIIDGPKPEFKTMMDTHTEWGKMVKVQIINHFKQSENNILIVEPPFVKLPFGDAISTAPEEEAIKDSEYTEQIHLENCSPSIRDIYGNLKNEFLKVKDTLKFNPLQQFIGVRDDLWGHPHRKNIAAIYVKRKKIWVYILLPETEAKKILMSKHHQVEPRDSKSSYVKIEDTNHWDEIQKLIATLVEKYQETSYI